MPEPARVGTAARERGVHGDVRAALPGDPFSVQFLRWLGLGSGGEPMGAHAALSTSAVYRAVALISGTIGTLPLRTLQPNSDGTQKRVPSFMDSPAGPRPFPMYTPFEWKELALVCLLLHGNAYAQHLYNSAGAIVGLNLLQPTAVHPEADPTAPGGRKYTVTLDDGGQIVLDGSKLTHIMGMSLDGVCGLSPISLARLTFSAARAGDQAAYQRFSNGAMIAGLVTPEDDDLDPDEARTVRETVDSAMTGPENAGAIAVVNRRLKFQPWMMSAVDAQFIQSRTFQIEEIGRWFGIPPHLLGQSEKSTSWGTGIEEQNRGLARHTLQPWTVRMEQRLSRLVAGSRKVEFDYAQLLAPSPVEEITLILDQVNGGLITPNEGRRVRNLPPIEGGDKLRLPSGVLDPNAPKPLPTPAKGGA